jgi:hypothetical protein
MSDKIRNLFVVLVSGTILFILFSCSNHSPREVTRGVYFWKTIFSLSSEEQNWLKDSRIKKLYVKFFDIDWNPKINSAMPVGDVSIYTKEVADVEIIPVVFITNRTLTNVPDSLLSELSKNIYNKISDKLNQFDSLVIKEIQLDCDWTRTTKDKYFYIIDMLKQLSLETETEITSTVRLHQIKFFDKTGVPPVKRVKLMFYNMSNVTDIKTRNSIFHKDIAKNYLVNFDNYPLNLDVVLPAFSWVCLFRNDKLVNLINDVKDSDLEKNFEFIRGMDNFYIATTDCYLKGFYVSKGDVLRVEKITPKTTLSAARMIAPYITNNKIIVSIYHLNNELIKYYDKNYLENIFAAFN